MKYIILLASLSLIFNVYAADNHNHAQGECTGLAIEKNEEHDEDEHEDSQHKTIDNHSSHETDKTDEENHDDPATHVEAKDEHEGHDHAMNEESEEESQEVHNEDEENGISVCPTMVKTVGIMMEKAHGGTITQYTTLPAEIKLNRDKLARISPKYDSTVRQIFVEIGDTVKKGDVIVSLENISTLSVYTILAPFDGTIISKNVSIGESIEGNSTILELADLTTVWADISVYPKYQHKIKKGTLVTIAADDHHNTREKISYISPIVSEVTRTFIARVVLPNIEGDFKPGSFVRAKVQLDKKDVAIRVNQAAVQTIGGESVVFIKEYNKFTSKTVKTGLYDNQYIEIISGLKAGDLYVDKGAFTLKAEITTSGLDPHAGHGH